MTNTRQKYADTKHASAIGFLVLALVSSPASAPLAAVFSALCIVSAWFAWARDSRELRMTAVTRPAP